MQVTYSKFWCDICKEEVPECEINTIKVLKVERDVCNQCAKDVDQFINFIRNEVSKIKE